jgi:CRISPR/Cas system CSM-associated protein Csm2 small subunit
MSQDEEDEEDLSEDEINKIKSKATENISDIAAQYIDKFHKNFNDCNTIYEYYSLLTAVFVFKNLVVSQLRRELEQVDDQDPNEVVKQLEDMAVDISKLVVVGFSKKSMN